MKIISPKTEFLYPPQFIYADVIAVVACLARSWSSLAALLIAPSNWLLYFKIIYFTVSAPKLPFYRFQVGMNLHLEINLLIKGGWSRDLSIDFFIHLKSFNLCFYFSRNFPVIFFRSQPKDVGKTVTSENLWRPMLEKRNRILHNAWDKHNIRNINWENVFRYTVNEYRIVFVGIA